MSYRDVDLMSVLDAVAYALLDACLVGNPCPKVERMWKRMNDPRVGDLVAESSTGPMRMSRRGPRGAAKSEAAIGILERRTREPVGGEWDEGEPRPDEEVWYIRRLDNGEPVRWANASFFVAIPVEGWEPFAKVLPDP
jgi:hypothetical protein